MKNCKTCRHFLQDPTSPAAGSPGMCREHRNGAEMISTLPGGLCQRWVALEVKLSKGNSKMGKVWNVSLTPGKACQACGPVPCQKACYAMKAYKQYPATRAAWDGNHELAQHDPLAFFGSIRDQLERARKLPRFFRWHVAGDIISFSYFANMVAIAQAFPAVKFLVFTKQHEIVNRGLVPGIKNLSIVFSAWPGMPMENPHGLPVAYMQDGTEDRVPADAIECPGNCETCGMCWQLPKIGRDVVFAAH